MPASPKEPRYQVGDTIAGRYRLEALLGAGGFGEVYQATQINLGREVALKLLLHDRMGSEKHLRRFLREAQLARELEHPNTVRLLDFGQADDGLPYIAYQLLRGRSLKLLLDEQGALVPSRTIRIISQVLKSLMEAHERGIIHRDIKPDNIFMTDFEGEPDFVKVLDLGIAKPVGPGRQDVAMTADDEVIGTPNYMAPEQVLGEPVCPATDIYSLGLVMAEMLAGQVIIGGTNPIKILTEHITDDVVRLPVAIESSPLVAVIRRATAKSLADRYSAADHMLADLRQTTDGMSPKQLEVVLSTGSGLMATEATESVSVDVKGFSERSIAFAETAARTDLTSSSVSVASPTGIARWIFVSVLLVVMLIAGGLVAVGVGALILRRSSTLEPSTPDLPSKGTVFPTDGRLAHKNPSGPHGEDTGPPPIDARSFGSEPSSGADASSLLVPMKLSELTPELLEAQLRKTGWSVGMASDVSQRANSLRSDGVNIQILKGDAFGSVTFFRYESQHYAEVMERGFQRPPFAVARVEKNLIYIALFTGYDSSPQTAVAEKLLSTIIVRE